MANDIGNFFRAEPVREDAIAGIANHIDKFWTKSMRRKMAAHGEAGLDERPLRVDAPEQDVVRHFEHELHQACQG